jgi:hypothetical protein
MAVFGDKWVRKLFIPNAIDAYNHNMNGADIANQRRKYISTQRRHTIRSWRPLFHWLLDMSLVNSFFLWQKQVHREDPKVKWDLYGFCDKIADMLLLYKSPRAHKKLGKCRRGAFPVTAKDLRGGLTPIETGSGGIRSPERRPLGVLSCNTRPSGGLSKVTKPPKGVPTRVFKTTDMKSINFALQHDRVRRPSRTYCIWCRTFGKILGGPPGKEKSENWRGSRTDGGCLQCNVTLCLKSNAHGWEAYHKMKASGIK